MKDQNLNLTPDFKEMPDFSDSQYEDLILSLINGACIFFGAGISKFAGYKLWKELRDALVDYFWNKKGDLSSFYLSNHNFDYSMCENLKKHNIIQAFDYLHSINSKLFITGIKDIFEMDSKDNNNEIYQFLKRLNNGKNIFITTNIDNGFQKYLGLPDKKISISPPNNINSPKLITYLHGRIDKENTWIFTTSQYNKVYEGKAPCMKYLKKVFRDRVVLFIGYGLREDEILRAINLTDKLKAHYWLEEYSRSNIDDLKIRSTSLRENYNIRLIPYCIDNRNRFELICEIIDSLYRNVTGRREI